MADLSQDGEVKILIGSVGRRVYLVEWFTSALARLGVKGEVHVTEADRFSSGYMSAANHHLLPRYRDEKYAPAMLELFKSLRPHLYFSVNDFELETLSSTGLADRLRDFGGIVLALHSTRHSLVHDKWRMAYELQAEGVPTPATALLSNRRAVAEIVDSCEKIVIKDRFGSGSSGLLVIDSERVGAAAAWLSSRDMTDISPDAHDHLVVQPAISGSEHGIDIVTSLTSDSSGVSVLAREKLRMRSGETDQAETVDAAPFRDVSERIAAWTGHRGLIDVDVIVDAVGEAHVIDINPRFGGGYPFNHIAGADVPGFYAAAAAGIAAPSGWADYEVGYRSAKYESVVGTP